MGNVGVDGCKAMKKRGSVKERWYFITILCFGNYIGADLIIASSHKMKIFSRLLNKEQASIRVSHRNDIC